MAANYAKVNRVGRMEAGFQRSTCSKILTVLFWNIHNSESMEKGKTLFPYQNFQKHILLKKISSSDRFFAVNFMQGINIWEENTETEKFNGF